MIAFIAIGSLWRVVGMLLGAGIGARLFAMMIWTERMRA
jgi:hypothetical protein